MFLWFLWSFKYCLSKSKNISFIALCPTYYSRFVAANFVRLTGLRPQQRSWQRVEKISIYSSPKTYYMCLSCCLPVTLSFYGSVLLRSHITTTHTHTRKLSIYRSSWKYNEMTAFSSNLCSEDKTKTRFHDHERIQYQYFDGSLRGIRKVLLEAGSLLGS